MAKAFQLSVYVIISILVLNSNICIRFMDVNRVYVSTNHGMQWHPTHYINLYVQNFRSGNFPRFLL